MAVPWKPVIAIGVFSLCFCALMRGAATEEPPSRDLARLAAAYESQMKHSRWWDPEHGDSIDRMSDDMIPESLTHTWTARFIANPDVKVQRLSAEPNPDEFERVAISKLAKGADDIWQLASGGSWRYVAPLRAKKSCVVCHTNPVIALDDGLATAVAGSNLDENAILGYASVTLVRK